MTEAILKRIMVSLFFYLLFGYRIFFFFFLDIGFLDRVFLQVRCGLDDIKMSMVSL